MTKSAPGRPPLLEWLVGSLGVLIFVAILSAVLFHEATDDAAPPSILIEVTAIEPLAAGYIIRFDAHNTGDVTAAQVRVVATLTRRDVEIEEREATIDLLPPQSERRGGFFFESDPRTGSVSVRADGYIDP